MSGLYMTSGVNDLVADNEEFAIGVTESLAKYELLVWGATRKKSCLWQVFSQSLEFFGSALSTEKNFRIAKRALAPIGDLGKEAKDSNDKALVNRDRVVARYNIKPRSIYIITEFDRSATTILFPEEY